MEEKEYELYKKFAALETENTNLKSQMDRLSDDANTNQVNELYTAAKKKMYSWIAGLSVVFTLFGFVSISNIIEDIEAKFIAKGEEAIYTEITKKFIKDYEQSMIKMIIERVEPRIKNNIDRVEADFKDINAEFVKGEVERNVRELLTQTFKNVEQNESSSSTDYLAAVEKTYEKNTYWVIAASSVRRADVVNELERVRNKVGPQFKTLFPQADITDPFFGTSHYPLVIGANLPFQKATALRIRAIKAGFRNDTFLWKAKSYDD